jgi:hypothetical protein
MLPLYWFLMAFGWIAAAVNGAAMSWDGSYILFKTLDSQMPYVPHYRWVVVPPEAVALFASLFTENTTVLSVIYGLVCVLMSALTLAASYWIVRDQPGLFLWPALSFGIGMLPGTLALYLEVLQASQYFWPLILAIRIGMPRRVVPVAFFFAAVLTFTHPASLLLLGVAFGFALLSRFRKTNRLEVWQIIVLGMLLLLALLRFQLMHTPYESQRLEWEVFEDDFNTSVLGYPIWGLGLAGAAGLLVLAKQRWAFVLLIISGVILFSWANDSRLWSHAFAFRTWLPFFTLPLALMAFLDFTPTSRRRMIHICGLIFALSMLAQSLTWRKVTQEAQDRLAAAPDPCSTSQSMINWLYETPINHWSLTPYSLMWGGRQPQKILIYGQDCAEGRFHGGLQVNFWDKRDWEGGWFNLEPLRENLYEANTFTPVAGDVGS